jgi:hypothetical protein
LGAGTSLVEPCLPDRRESLPCGCVQAKLDLFSTHDEEGMTPLMVAAKYGHVYVCADLIRHKVRRSWCSYR